MSELKFKNLVFEGGGVKGIAYAGALKVLAEKNIMESITRVAGTSAGAITAALLAIGATDKDIQEIVGGTSFRKFMDDSWGLMRDANRLLKDYGWYKGDEFSKWIKKQVYALTGKETLTFADLEKLKSENPITFRSLYVVGTNLNLQLSPVFSAETTPDMELWHAVRISMSIPLFFAAVRDTNGDVLVDGGVSWNYPIDIFDDIKYLSDLQDKKLYTPPTYPTKYNDTHIYNKETLGFRVDTKDEIAAEKNDWRLPPRRIENFADYARALLDFMMDMANNMHLHKNDW